MQTFIGLVLFAAVAFGIYKLWNKDKSKNVEPGVPVSNTPTDVIGDGAVDPINRQGKQRRR